jgi:hypothetical protein
MLRIVIVEPEIFTLLHFKTAIEKSSDIEFTGDTPSGNICLQLVEKTKLDKDGRVRRVKGLSLGLVEFNSCPTVSLHIPEN